MTLVTAALNTGAASDARVLRFPFNWMGASLKSRPGAHEGFLFIVVGGANTLFAYGIFVVIYYFFECLPYLLILALTYFLGSVVSFFSQKYLVFGVRQRLGPDFFRFQVSGVLVLLVNALFLVLLIEVAGLRVLASQAIATVISVAATYFLHKFYSFRRQNLT